MCGSLSWKLFYLRIRSSGRLFHKTLKGLEKLSD
jgi:hypothetical protein